jgi:hypothetical protein
MTIKFSPYSLCPRIRYVEPVAPNKVVMEFKQSHVSAVMKIILSFVPSSSVGPDVSSGHK